MWKSITSNTRQMAALEEAFRKASSKFKISKTSAYQKLAIRNVCVEKDVFVNLPTGSGNLLIYHMGTSEDNKMAAFRECCGQLHELRSLAPKAKMIALTATATKLTKETILNIFLMENPFEV